MKNISRPHGNDKQKNLDVGGVIRAVCQRAANDGLCDEHMDQRVGQFVNVYASCAWDAAIEWANQPSLN